MLLGYTEIHIKAIGKAENHNLYKIYKDKGKGIGMFEYDEQDDSKYLYFPVPKFEGWKDCNLWLGDSSKRPKQFDTLNAEKFDAEENNKAKVAAEEETDDEEGESDEEEEESVPTAKVVEEESENP